MVNAGVAVDCRDRQTVEALYKRLAPLALAKAIRLVGRADIAQELVQATFLKLWTTAPQFANDKAAYRWIYVACHNAGIDHLRSATSRNVAMEPEHEPYAAGVQDVAVESQRIAAQVLKALGPRDAAMYFYRVIDGMSHQEIADCMELSKKTVTRTIVKIEQRLARFRTGERVWPAPFGRGTSRSSTVNP